MEKLLNLKELGKIYNIKNFNERKTMKENEIIEDEIVIKTRKSLKKYEKMLNEMDSITKVDLYNFTNSSNFYLAFDRNEDSYVYDFHQQLLLNISQGEYGEPIVHNHIELKEEELESYLQEDIERLPLQLINLPEGSIVWSGEDIIGIKGLNLDLDKYNDYNAYQIGKTNDYELIKKKA